MKYDLLYSPRRVNTVAIPPTKSEKPHGNICLSCLFHKKMTDKYQIEDWKIYSTAFLQITLICDYKYYCPNDKC